MLLEETKTWVFFAIFLSLYINWTIVISLEVRIFYKLPTFLPLCMKMKYCVGKLFAKKETFWEWAPTGWAKHKGGVMIHFTWHIKVVVEKPQFFRVFLVYPLQHLQNATRLHHYVFVRSKCGDILTCVIWSQTEKIYKLLYASKHFWIIW